LTSRVNEVEVKVLTSLASVTEITGLNEALQRIFKLEVQMAAL
jgi:hypothetical protein